MRGHGPLLASGCTALSVATWSSRRGPFRLILQPRRGWPGLKHGGGGMQRFGPLSRRSKPGRCLGPPLAPGRSSGDGHAAGGLPKRAALICGAGAGSRGSGPSQRSVAGGQRGYRHVARTPGSRAAFLGRPPAGLNDTYVTPALSALWAFVPPPAVVRLSPKSDGPGQDTAAPILPTLSVEGLSLAGVRAMPGGQGQMLCLIYARPDATNIALCVEKAGDPGDSVPRVSGSFPSSMIAWRQKGANYALTGALPEPELRALADAARAEVAAFDGW